MIVLVLRSVLDLLLLLDMMVLRNLLNLLLNMMVLRR